MGLLEKALQFKNQLNNRGKETLIDKIIGPAETVMLKDEPAPEGINSDKTERLSNQLEIDEFIHKQESIKKSEVSLESDDTFSEFDSKEQSNDGEMPVTSEEDIVFLSENELDEIENGISKQADADKHEIPGHDHFSDKADLTGVEDESPVKSDDDFKNLEFDDFDTDIHSDFGVMDDSGLKISGESNADDKAYQSYFKGVYSDYMALYENCKEIEKTTTVESFFDVLSFLIMGQIGVSSSALLLQESNKPGKWYIAESKGIIIEDKDIDLTSYSAILSQVLREKQIIDIEDFKDDDRFIEEFYKYISIDARLLVPLHSGDEVVAIITVGDKITAENFSEEEQDYLYAVAEFSAFHLMFLLKQAKDLKDNDTLEKYISYTKDLDRVIAQINLSPEAKTVREIIQNEFRSLGVECFGVYIRSTNFDRYVPLIYEKEDYLLYGELDFGIKAKSNFISFLQEGDVPLKIENINHSRLISEVFNENQIAHFLLLRLYPFRFGREIPGFIMINKIADYERLDEIDIKVKKISEMIFPLIISMETLNLKKKKYIDNVELIYKKIEDEITNAKNINIPLTLVLFSIKNYKRYYNLYGIDEARKLLDHFEKIIRSRLSDGDFSVRYDRHKILIVLPGKDKKFAVPLANAIRNEIVQSFKKKEIQLLLTFLTAEYPEDGNSVYSLMDAID
ncbi:MAG TPA: diguanylate cyclase [Spirochaetota bacterium]|nr:diguanylate cyclase [Spirochaetota bacterium]HPI90010.1 diguanylate cyclase [Spirochaetota bacterium]HPR47266.1 diguanylate cyclase [Spirochaetota bacterium]